MSKREHGKMNGFGENEETRHKRRRDAGESSPDVDISVSDPIIKESKVRGLVDAEKVKEDGLSLWQTVKDAVNKDGRSLSFDFIRKPSKRLYPDYYELIQQPIAFDDIKKQLDAGAYPSLEAVKNDFELCFSNAKQYNQTESIIFQDAKELLRLVHKTYNKMVPSEEDAENGKLKTPNLNRLIKARLEKLVGKSDPIGRVLSDEFMQLPSKKTWPFYYKEIKKPQCFENIFKRIKRKEYQSSSDFAADVELVFSNALSFNQDETPIWHDAVALRDYFRQLMSDLPQPHSLPEYARPSNKIKIRPPQATQPTASNSIAQNPKPEPTVSSSLFLRVPAQNAKPPPPTAPVAPVPQVPPALPSTVQAPKKVPAPKASIAQAQPQAPTPKLPAQSVSFINATPSHYPNASYFPQAAATTSTASATPPILRASSIMNTQSASQSPAPVTLPPNHQLKSVNLLIEPRGRTFDLDHKVGVKSWAVRLIPGETSIRISNVSFLADEEDDTSGDEEADVEKHEGEEDVDMDVDIEVDAPLPVRNGRKKGKGKGRGKPARGSTVTTRQAAAKTMKQPKKVPPKIGEVQVKLNGSLVKEQSEQAGQWSISVSLGSSVVEVGEVGGMLWKVYVDRVGPA